MRGVCSDCVLLVHDPTIRDLLARRLEQAGFEARRAEDGIDGLVKLRDELPKVIVSDLQMPRLPSVPIARPAYPL
jgi:DNA-binding response OmpR family regulator